jgi:serine/threonine-protein kinase
MTASLNRTTALLSAGVLAGSLLLAPSPAAAQSVEAEALWQDAKRLMKEGKTAEACVKFEASDRLDSTPGSLLVVGDCNEKLNKLATAWSFFLKSASMAKSLGDGKRQAEAKKRADALAPRLSYLTISVPESSKVDGLVILKNGAPVDALVWNTGVPVDAGTYEITGQAPGHEPWSTKVTIDQEAQKASVEVPRFKQIEDLIQDTPPGGGDTPPGGGDTPPGGGALPDGPTGPTDDSRPGGGTFTTMRKASIGAAAVGVAGLAAGVVFGLKSKDLQSQADELCPEAACADPDAIALNDDAQSAAMKANLGLVVGGVAVAGAVALWILGAPDDPGEVGPVAVSPALGADHVGLSFAGRF